MQIVSLPERGVSTHFGAMRLWSHSHPSRSVCPRFSPPSSLPRLLPPLSPSLAPFLPPLPPAALDGIETAVRNPQESSLEEMESFQHHVKKTLRGKGQGEGPGEGRFGPMCCVVSRWGGSNLWMTGAVMPPSLPPSLLVAVLYLRRTVRRDRHRGAGTRRRGLLGLGRYARSTKVVAAHYSRELRGTTDRSRGGRRFIFIEVGILWRTRAGAGGRRRGASGVAGVTVVSKGVKQGAIFGLYLAGAVLFCFMHKHRTVKHRN